MKKSLLWIKISEVVKINSNNINEKLKKLLFYKKPINRDMDYLTIVAKITFSQLKKVITKAFILQHFNLKYYIWIKTDIFNYIISKVLSQLTWNNLSQ